MTARRTRRQHESAVYLHATWEERGSDPYLYETGIIVTKQGIVHAYTEPDFTDLTFVKQGRRYDLYVSPGLSRRGAVTEARRWVRSLIVESGW